MTETVTDIAPEQTADPMAAPLHAALQAALTPYMSGAMKPTGDLVDALLDILASSEPTPALISTLGQAVTGLVPTTPLMGPIHHALGAALNLNPNRTTYQAPQPTRPAVRRATSSTAKPGTIPELINKVFAANPGVRFSVSSMVKELGDATSGPGAVGAALDRMITRGEAVLIGTDPKLYLSRNDAGNEADTAPQDANAHNTAPESAPDTDADTASPAESDPYADDAVAEAPRTDNAPDAAEATDANDSPISNDKPAATRRSKTAK